MCLPLFNSRNFCTNFVLVVIALRLETKKNCKKHIGQKTQLWNKHKICAEVAWVEQRQTYSKEFWVFNYFKKCQTFLFGYYYSNVNRLQYEKWKYLETLWTCLKLFWPILYHLYPFLLTIQDHRGPCGTILDHSWPYGTILDHTGPFWTVRDHTEP